MNYNRVKFLFIELYKELCETFDDFEADFATAIRPASVQKEPCLVVIASQEESDKVTEYFEKITQSREAVESFIKKLAPSVKARQRFDVSSSYHYLVAKETRSGNIEIGRNTAVNYAAFKRKLASAYGMTQKDIHALIKAVN
jgi:hypothetical protein